VVFAASEDPPLAFTPKKRKTLESAQKYAQKGSYDKALAEYDKLLKADPRDSNIRLKIGDLLLKKGDKAKALQTYTEVAEMFSRGGFDAKAVAIYKQILRTEEDSLEARTHLGECFQRMGLTSDALREFQEAFKICQKKELKREAFDLLRRVASLDPSNIANRLNLADLFAREKMEDDARREYTSLLEEVRKQTSVDLLIRVAEQMRRAFPDSREALDALAWGRIQTGEHAEAAKLLKAALAKNPDDIPLRETLVAALEASGDEAGARKLWREIAELYKTRGDVEKSREIMQRHGGLASFGGSSEETTTPSILLTEPTGAKPAPTFDTDDDEDDIQLDDEAHEPPPKPAPKRPAIVEKDAPNLQHKHTPSIAKPAASATQAAKPASSSAAEMLAEARVSLEFGDPAEAMRLARLVLEADPDSKDARKILADAERPAGKGPAIELDAPGDDDAPEIERSSLVEEPKKTGAAALRGKPEIAALGANEDFDSLPDIEIVLEDEEDKDGKFASVEPPSQVREAPAVLAKVAKAAPAKPAPAPAPVAEDEDFEIEIEVEGESPEPEPEPAPEIEPPPQADDSAADLDLDLDVGHDDDSLEFSEPLASEREEAGSFAQSSARVEENLSEADFYLEQGLMDDAERLYRKVLKGVPGHPKAQLRLGEIEARRAKGGGKAAKAPARKAAPAKLERDPLGDTMVRDSDGDEAISIPDLPEELVAPAKKDKSAAASRPTPVIAKPAPKVTPPKAKPGPAKPERTVIAEDTVPPLELEEPPEDLSSLVEEANAEPEFNPADLTAEMEEADAEPIDAEEAVEDEDEFDLARELDDDDDTSGGTIGTLVGMGSLGKGFADVFSAFKKGIQEHVAEGDADTHYDLAIAYKEMGLNEDAVRELETVLKTGARSVEALSLMATCKLALGMAEEAAAHLEDALERAGDSDESSVALRYDLAEALLAAGREAEALEAFQKVHAADPEFRDVGERISRFS
jgi:tetratricopeptide (TPR) repeat protein